MPVGLQALTKLEQGGLPASTQPIERVAFFRKDPVILEEDWVRLVDRAIGAQLALSATSLDAALSRCWNTIIAFGLKKMGLTSRWQRAVPVVLATAILGLATNAAIAQLRVRVNRWLEVRRVSGAVVYQRGQTRQAARVGLRLQSVGEVIRTGPRSSAVLAVDTGIGFVNISQNTTVRIQQLQTTSQGGRITRLQVTGGQARLQVRRFTHSGSRLEIQTPAGISGVRGTQFGVSVDPVGKTGVATLEGSVVAQAQGRSVLVKGGFQSLVVPGQPPSPPVPLRDDTRLNLVRLTAESRSTARVVGQIDPVNLLVVADRIQVVDGNGRFDLQVPLSGRRQVTAVVVTPLGKQQVYELAVP